MGELKITTTGNKFAAERFRKMAREQMTELKRSMVRGKGVFQNKLERRPAPGVVISCHSYFGNDTVNIHVEPAGELKKLVGRKYEILEDVYWYAFNSPVIDEAINLGTNIIGDIETDIQGNTYVVSGAKTTTYPSSGESIIVKYDKDGLLKWRKMITNSGDEYEMARAIEVDRLTGDFYVAYNHYNDPRVQSYDCYVAKYNRAGVLQWQRGITLGSGVEVDIFAFGDAITLDLENSANDQYTVVGRLYHWDCCLYQAFIVRFNSSGSIDWQKKVGVKVDGDPTGCSGTPGSWTEDPPPAGDYATIEERPHFEEAVTDSSNNVYAVGHHFPENIIYPDGLIVKFSPTGAVEWKRSIHGETVQNNSLINWYDNGVQITNACVDATGNLYVIAHTHIWTVDLCHINIFKFSSSGSLIWHRIVEVMSPGDWWPQDPIKFSGEIAVWGRMLYVLFPRYPSGTTLMGMTLARISVDDGAPLWQRTLSIPSFLLGSVTIGGIFPKGLEARAGDLHIAAEIEDEQLSVTMKLPGSATPLGQFHRLNVAESSLTFYSSMAAVPYREEEAGSGHYSMTVTDDFTLTVASGDFTINTVTDGETLSDSWAVTEDVFIKRREVEVQ